MPIRNPVVAYAKRAIESDIVRAALAADVAVAQSVRSLARVASEPAPPLQTNAAARRKVPTTVVHSSPKTSSSTTPENKCSDTNSKATKRKAKKPKKSSAPTAPLPGSIVDLPPVTHESLETKPFRFSLGSAGGLIGTVPANVNITVGVEADAVALVPTLLDDAEAACAMVRDAGFGFKDVRFVGVVNADAGALITISIRDQEMSSPTCCSVLAASLTKTRVTATGQLAVLGSEIIVPTAMVGELEDHGPAILAHEMLHALGLAHSDFEDDLMFPQFVGQVGLGPGDLAGLGLLGVARQQLVETEALA